MEDSASYDKKHAAMRALVYVCLIYFPLMLFFNLLRFWGYGFDTPDFGTFYQLIWNSANGNFLASSTKFPFDENSSRLGFHFSLLVTVIGTAVYKIFQAAESLLALHVLSVTLTSIPLFFALKNLTNERRALFWSLVYLFNPITLYHAMFSLQDVSLAVFFMALALYALTSRKLILFLFSLSCLLLAKEHYGLSVAGFGLLWWIRNKSPKVGISLVLIGLAATYIIIFQIMPRYSPYGTHYLLATDVYNSDFFRYQWLQTPEILRGLALIIFSASTVYTLAVLFVPLLLAPLLGAVFLLPAIGEILMNLLSANTLQRSMVLYYWAGATPFLVTAAAYGTRRFGKKVHIAIATVTFAAASIVLYFPVQRLAMLQDKKMDWAFGESFKSVEPHVPKDGLLMAVGGVGPHFANRRLIAPLDEKAYEKADYILFRLNHRKYLPLFQIPDNSMVYVNFATVLQSQNWGIVYWEYPYALFKRGAADVYDRQKVIEETKAQLAN